ncbi:MAG: 3-deoxy-D-manno-octulosonate 8-phosphate phosphatase, partial [Flavobacteriia bacterium]|nr:3-deoxy-D-manno-octulosonate 8-phosphate phosphatase [Flavobacteriia bacterium]
MISYKEKLNTISTFIFDVDGVLTDGKVYLFKDEIVRAINSKDAYALQYSAKMGFRTFIISGGNSEEVRTRLMEFGVTEVHLSVHEKLRCYEDIKKRFKLKDAEILYMGDDIPDIP